MPKPKSLLSGRKYTSVSQDDLPTGRKGKHYSIVHELLDELDKLGPGNALKVALEELPDKKANVRSALGRAARQRGIEIATSSDDDHFYIWIPS